MLNITFMIFHQSLFIDDYTGDLTISRRTKTFANIIQSLFQVVNVYIVVIVAPFLNNTMVYIGTL